MKQSQRSEYPISPEAKELAKLLVQFWDEAKTKQFVTHPHSKYLDSSRPNVSCYELMPQSGGNLKEPILPHQYGQTEFIELERCGLIEWQNGKRLLLFQTLRDAVNTDFVKPDNATGFNINGNVGSINSNSTISNQQNVGVNYGVVNMTSHEIADKLIEILGQNLIDSDKDLRSSNEDEKPSRLKRIATTLTNMIGIGADAVTLAPALGFLIALL